MKSQTVHGLSSCSKFPESLSSYFFCQKKTIKRKDRNMEFEMISEVLNQSADVFSKHTADIGSFNFVEYGI